MIVTIAAILVIMWLLGFSVFGITSSLLHLLLVAAVIVILWRVINGRRPIA
ncbi:MAG TPA: lmo0937 family membrane protein [Gemmatimonadales bacterium]|nr:lmo0937 family membrane protein [Gemmatimonadales bacterium]